MYVGIVDNYYATVIDKLLLPALFKTYVAHNWKMKNIEKKNGTSR
jgi:hypothetical protein